MTWFHFSCLDTAAADKAIVDPADISAGRCIVLGVEHSFHLLHLEWSWAKDFHYVVGPYFPGCLGGSLMSGESNE